MGSAFHQLCPKYSGTLTPTAPTVIRLWEAFTFTFSLLPSIAGWTSVVKWMCHERFFPLLAVCYKMNDKRALSQMA